MEDGIKCPSCGERIYYEFNTKTELCNITCSNCPFMKQLTLEEMIRKSL